MAAIEIKMNLDPAGLLRQIEAMGQYLDAHQSGSRCPFVDLALEVGEIDGDTDISFTTEKRDGEYFVVPEARGDLARLLEAFQAVAP